jgi:hypothetical protein
LLDAVTGNAVKRGDFLNRFKLWKICTFSIPITGDRYYEEEVVCFAKMRPLEASSLNAAVRVSLAEYGKARQQVNQTT